MYKFRQRNLFFSEVPKVDLFDFGIELFNCWNIYTFWLIDFCFCLVKATRKALQTDARPSSSQGGRYNPNVEGSTTNLPDNADIYIAHATSDGSVPLTKSQPQILNSVHSTVFYSFFPGPYTIWTGSAEVNLHFTVPLYINVFVTCFFH